MCVVVVWYGNYDCCGGSCIVIDFVFLFYVGLFVGWCVEVDVGEDFVFGVGGEIGCFVEIVCFYFMCVIWVV